MKCVAFGLSLVLLATGCDKLTEKLGQKVAEKAVEGASGGDVKVDTSSGSVTTTDKKTGTTVQGGANVKLPDGWPTTVPIYPGAAVRNAMKTGGGMSATVATKDPPAKVIEFYKKSGLKLEAEMDLGVQHMMNFKNGKGTVTVMVSQAGAETMTSITVAD